MMPGPRLLCLVLAVLVAAGAPAVGVRAAERVAVRVGEHPGFSRIVFDWGRPVGARVERQKGQKGQGGNIVLRFDRVGELDLARFRADPPPEVSRIAARPEGDGLVVTLTVVAGAGTRLFESQGKTVLDVLKPGTSKDSRPATPEDWRRRRGAEAKPAPAPAPERRPNRSKAGDAATDRAAKAAAPKARAGTPPARSAPISLLPPAPVYLRQHIRANKW